MNLRGKLRAWWGPYPYGHRPDWLSRFLFNFGFVLLAPFHALRLWFLDPQLRCRYGKLRLLMCRHSQWLDVHCKRCHELRNREMDVFEYPTVKGVL